MNLSHVVILNLLEYINIETNMKEKSMKIIKLFSQIHSTLPPKKKPLKTKENSNCILILSSVYFQYEKKNVNNKDKDLIIFGILDLIKI